MHEVLLKKVIKPESSLKNVSCSSIGLVSSQVLCAMCTFQIVNISFHFTKGKRIIGLNKNNGVLLLTFAQRVIKVLKKIMFMQLFSFHLMASCLPLMPRSTKKFKLFQVYSLFFLYTRRHFTLNPIIQCLTAYQTMGANREVKIYSVITWALWVIF